MELIDEREREKKTYIYFANINATSLLDVMFYDNVFYHVSKFHFFCKWSHLRYATVKCLVATVIFLNIC